MIIQNPIKIITTNLTTLKNKKYLTYFNLIIFVINKTSGTKKIINK